MLSNLGEETIASHAIAMQVTTVTFMLPLSVGLAAAVRTGNLLGAREFIGARYSSFFAIVTAVSLASFNFLGLIFFGDKFASWFNADPSVIALSSSLLFVAAFMQLSDGISFTGPRCFERLQRHLCSYVYHDHSFLVFWPPIGYSLGLTDFVASSSGSLWHVDWYVLWGNFGFYLSLI